MQKFIKYFYFSCNSFFGTFILAFSFHGNAVFLFRENTVAYYIFLSHLLVAGCDIGVRFSVRPSVPASVRPSVNIYVDVRHLCQS